uniref:Uncharacterized protein n=2 Tax=Photinus pyralis TaxID=7054 RepID=A0A1Y1LNE0_PHOPY
MMEGEVIAISDAESSGSLVLLNTNEQPSHISVSKENTSTSSQSYRKLKNSSMKYLNVQGASPSPRTKVSDWLLANYQASNIKVVPNSLPFFSDNKSSILVRQDYAKPHRSTLPDNSTSNSNYNENSKYNVISVTSSVCSSFPSNHKQTTELTKHTVLSKSVQSSSSCDTPPLENLKLSAANGTKSSSPANVEVPNKLELCEYLKLMNPKDLRAGGFKQNRRSVRVKNLAIMSQQRALERELNSVEEKKSTPDSSLQSISSKELPDKHTENVEKTSSCNVAVSVPTVQVPEITTTCVLRTKSRNRRRSCNVSENNAKLDVAPCQTNSSPIPNAKAVESLSSSNIRSTRRKDRLLKSPHSHLLKYLNTIPPTNFDEFYSTYLNDIKLPKMEKKKEIGKPSFNGPKYKPKKSKIINELKYKLRRKLRLNETTVKQKLRPTHERQKPNSKHQRRLKLYLRKRNLTKLRSRGKLREIGIKSVLLNHERLRKKIKRKTKLQAVAPVNCEEKDFRSANLIQNPITQVPEEPISPNKTELSAVRLLKLRSDIDLLKDLTPEHRKALFESKRFLFRANSNDNAEASTKTVPHCDIPAVPEHESVASAAQLQPEVSQSCAEDEEVDKLMNGNLKRVRGRDSAIQNAPTDFKEHCSRETESLKSSCSTSVSTGEDDAHVPCSQEVLPTAYSHTETCSTHENDVRVENGSNNVDNQPEVMDITGIQCANVRSVHSIENNEAKVKSLHQCLTQTKKKPQTNCLTGKRTKTDRRVSQSYAIDLSVRNGAIMNAYYLDYNLVIVQELLVSFWTQTPLGNVLGAHDMWMPKGDTKRLVLGNGCLRQDSSDTVTVMDTSIAYFELWTKEHVSDRRERPVADIFVTIYLKLMGGAPDKKVLQLENIHGYANDVQYIVIKNFPVIVVSWNTIHDQLTSTVIHRYQLSSDYKTVVDITSMHAATHYISSLHNIEGSDTLIMGCGEDKITLWHLEDGYVVATMDLMSLFQQPRTLWATADRGFIFTLHNFNDGHLHLIATNSFDYSWKQLQVYKQESDYENLVGICIENGLVVAFYETGVVCWKAMSGELVLDSSCDDSIFLPFGKHIVIITNNRVQVRHVLEYLVTIDEDL